MSSLTAAFTGSFEPNDKTPNITDHFRVYLCDEMSMSSILFCFFDAEMNFPLEFVAGGTVLIVK